VIRSVVGLKVLGLAAASNPFRNSDKPPLTPSRAGTVDMGNRPRAAPCWRAAAAGPAGRVAPATQKTGPGGQGIGTSAVEWRLIWLIGLRKATAKEVRPMGSSRLPGLTWRTRVAAFVKELVLGTTATETAPAKSGNQTTPKAPKHARARAIAKTPAKRCSF
jgi:hypothetical protein